MANRARAGRMGLTQAAYGARRKAAGLPCYGHGAIIRAIKDGRIALFPDGTIDPERSDRLLATMTDPAKQRKPMKPVPQAAVKAVADTLMSDGGQMTMVEARLANTILQAQERKQRLDERRGKLVDRAKATNAAFVMARQARDSWQNWPLRVAALMAAELGIEQSVLYDVLDRAVRDHLTELGEMRFTL